MTWLRIDHPEPAKRRQRILPVFLPFHGCTHRCLYCAQHLQTGVGVPSLREIHDHLVHNLTHRARHGDKGLGVAFYGGTFTALPKTWQKRLLDLADTYKKAGLVTHVRCSTRPDRVDPAHLLWLREMGLDMVELGIQSFDDRVLQAAQRGYDAKTAKQACRLIAQAGLELGIQLMPGLPGSTMQSWMTDVHQTTRLHPAAVRIYPCLVLQDTPLAQEFKKKAYQPWGLTRAVWAVSQGLLPLWEHGIAVIRIGLAPEHDLSRAILGGPWHPALGFMARSHALRAHILQALTGMPNVPLRLHVPRRFAAEFWGHGKENAPTWKRYGLSPNSTLTWDLPFFLFADRNSTVYHLTPPIKNTKLCLDSVTTSL